MSSTLQQKFLRNPIKTRQKGTNYVETTERINIYDSLIQHIIFICFLVHYPSGKFIAENSPFIWTFISNQNVPYIMLELK